MVKIKFIKQHHTFFKEYEHKFIELFLKNINKSLISNNILSEKEVKIIYYCLFIKPIILQNNKKISFLIEIENKLKKYDISFIKVLEKTFFFITNAFIKYLLLHQEPYNNLKDFTILCNFYLEYFRTHKIKNPTIPSEIIEIYKNHEKINLFNIYKGIPISYKSPILKIENNEITLNSNLNFIVASKFNPEIYFNQENKDYYFIATLKNFDIKNKIITLTNIQKIQRDIPKRKYIRVQPEKEIEANIIQKNRNIPAKIYDISIKGMALLTKKNHFTISENIEIIFNLELEKKYLFDIIGEIRSIIKIENNLYRYHIYFEANPKEEKILERYVVKREKEIIEELKKIIENQFFRLE
jgi:hypothetical protein